MPLKLWLALATDLSPDEAYYLCAARAPGPLPPLVDHPPLLPWLLRLSDGLPGPLELRVRVWPLAFSVGLGVAAVELARRRGADATGCVVAALLGSFSLLPLTGGFVATPDGPALLALAALLLLVHPGPGSPVRRWAHLGAGALVAAGALAKVVLLPLAALVALGARRDGGRRPHPTAPCVADGVGPDTQRGQRDDRRTRGNGPAARSVDRSACQGAQLSARPRGRGVMGRTHAPVSPGFRLTTLRFKPAWFRRAWGSRAKWAGSLALAAPLALALPLLIPSLRFQLAHAYAAAPGAPWAPSAALAALAEAVGVQALLWSPWVLALGARRLSRLPASDRAVAAGLTLLVAASALARGVAPEANWWAPAGLVLVVAAAIASSELAPRARLGMLSTAIVPALVAAAHALHPFLPLEPGADPSARLHGWSAGVEPRAAAGVGPYGPAAERCVYRKDCVDIDKYFIEMRSISQVVD